VAAVASPGSCAVELKALTPKQSRALWTTLLFPPGRHMMEVVVQYCPKAQAQRFSALVATLTPTTTVEKSARTKLLAMLKAHGQSGHQTPPARSPNPSEYHNIFTGSSGPGKTVSGADKSLLPSPATAFPSPFVHLSPGTGAPLNVFSNQGPGGTASHMQQGVLWTARTPGGTPTCSKSSTPHNYNYPSRFSIMTQPQELAQAAAGLGAHPREVASFSPAYGAGPMQHWQPRL
jgi:hypothetical protein